MNNDHSTKEQSECFTKTSDPPRFSRCSLGKNKWFWVVYRDVSACCDGLVDATGTAGSSLEAEQQARAAIRATYGPVEPEQLSTCYASGAYHREVVKRRSERAGRVSTDAQEIECLYTDWRSDYDGSRHSCSWRIVKKTGKRVYVEYRRRSWEEDGQTYQGVETIALDRRALEAEGMV